MRRIVVVGASLAGLRAAQSLRDLGHTGELTVVGDERHMPYDRPPLSKQLLDATVTRAGLDLPLGAAAEATWRLGATAVGLDLDGRRVRLRDGKDLPYDGLVIATGSRARPWPGQAPPGVLTVRTVDDAQALAAALGSARQLLVVGAGFLGGELAAAGRRRGLAVTLIDPQRLPLLSAVGPVVGAFVAELHRQSGVDLRLSTSVEAFTTGPDGRLSGARLSDGSHVPAEVAVAALGAAPNVEWLAGSGLRLDAGVVVDDRCRALLEDGTPASGVVAAGDVTRWPHPLSSELIALGHWTHATEQAAVAARTLLGPAERSAPYRPVPSFWSDLHGTALRSAGLPHLADASVATEHDPAARRLVVAYARDGAPVGVVTANRASRLAAARTALAERLGSAAPV